MVTTELLLPSGSRITSGTTDLPAVQSCTITRSVNAGQELTLGAVCAAVAELRLLVAEGELPIAAGDEFVLFRQGRQVGIFRAEKPVFTTRHTVTLTACDRVSLLDRDVSDVLEGLTGWPYTLQALAEAICTACGTELSGSIPGGTLPVEKFSARGVTGRKVLSWIGQLCGCFCRANAGGKLEFGWYEKLENLVIGPREDTYGWSVTPEGLSLRDPRAQAAQACLTLPAGAWEDGCLTVSDTRQQFHFLGKLQYADYRTAPIEKVQLQQQEQDVGTIYPADPGAKNTYRITGNPLLSGASPETRQTLAQRLYRQLQNVTYTPCRVQIPATEEIRPGHILTLMTPAPVTVYVMTKTSRGQTDTLECTGSASRDSVTAVNEMSLQSLSGKMLLLQLDVEGLRAENTAADGRMASLGVQVDGIDAQVEKQTADSQQLRRELTALQQSAERLQLTVQSICQQGADKVTTSTGYTFDDKGLHIARSGAQMENLLDNTGMYVMRSGQVILQANNDGVAATDVHVGNYLTVGCSRLERYEADRTACFYIS